MMSNKNCLNSLGNINQLEEGRWVEQGETLENRTSKRLIHVASIIIMMMMMMGDDEMC